MNMGTIKIDGADYKVRNAYSTGPGAKPHSFDVPNGHVYEFGGTWKFNRRYGCERVVTVDTSGYKPPKDKS